MTGSQKCSWCGGEAVRSDDLLAKSSEYSISLQRAIEFHCRGLAVPPDVMDHCPHHAKILNEHLAHNTREQGGGK